MQWLAPELIARIAPTLGIRVDLEPGYRYVGMLTTPDGRRFSFRNTNLDVNGQGTAELLRDKAYAAYFLARLGYPVAAGETFYSERWCEVVDSDRDAAAGYAYARGAGFPVVVKPNSKSQGTGVALVHNKRDFLKAMRAVFELGDRVALVQPWVHGEDHRLVVLDGEVLVAYARSPLAVTGDGRSSVRALLAKREHELAEEGRRVRLRAGDYRLALRLKRLGLGLDDIPAAGRRLVLRDNANLSTGGDAHDVTDSLHEGYRTLCARIASDMGVRYAGIDLLTRRPVTEAPDDYTVLEINPAPGLDHYARLGEPQMARAEACYQRLLQALLRQDP